MAFIAQNDYLDSAFKAVKQCFAKLGLAQGFKWLDRVETNFDEVDLPKLEVIGLTFVFLYEYSLEMTFQVVVTLVKVNKWSRTTNYWVVERVDVGTEKHPSALKFCFFRQDIYRSFTPTYYFDHIISWKGEFPYHLGKFHGDIRDWWEKFIRFFKWRFLDRSYQGT